MTLKNKIDKAEGDRIAGMVLALVTEIARKDHRRDVPPSEPTSTGYIDPEIWPYVMKRSA